MHKSLRAALLAAALLSLMGTAASAAKDVALPPRFQKWLDEVAVLITPPEREAFLALKEDARRDAFITAFWNARDPDPAHPDDSYRQAFYTRRELAKERYKSYTNDPAKVFILNGEPYDIYKTECGLALWPIEIWYYRSTPRMVRSVPLLFYRPAAGPTLVLWHAEDGFNSLMAFPKEDRNDTTTLSPEFGEDTRTTGGWYDFVRYVRRFCRTNEEIQRVLTAVRDVQSFSRTATMLTEAPPLADPEWLTTFAAGSTDAPAEQARDPLSAEELRWLDEVAVLISPEERRAYLALRRSYQRAGFVEAFWKARDTNPKTPDNEARGIFEARVETARNRWKSLVVDAARVYLLNGEALTVWKSDCNGRLWPIEIWSYAYSDRSRRPFELLFFQSGEAGPFRLWRVEQGYAVLQRVPTADVMANPNPRPGLGYDGEFAAFYQNLEGWCPVESQRIARAMRRLEQGDRMLAEVIEQTPPVDLEWLAAYRTFSTEVAASTKPLEAELAVDYPGRHQSRTLVRGTLRVPDDAGAAGGGGSNGGEVARAYSLIGEVLRDDVLHESFRYYFQLVAPADDGSYPLVFERFLRPGDFRLVLKLEDAQSGRAVRIVRELTVPAVAETAAATTSAAPAPPPQPGAEGFHLLAPATDVVSGVVRIDAEVGDERVREVAFSLDGKPILAKRRPPWSVELRLGELPRSMRVRAVARDAAGEVIAADEVQLNPAPHRFAVRLVEPREGSAVAAGKARGLRVRAAVQVPPDHTIDRLELFLDETPVATLFQEPWETVVSRLPSPPPTFLRAVAHLTDGTTAEDVVLLAGGDVQRGAVEVDLVEVYTAALDGQGRPVHDLAESDFVVREDGRPQELRRFQRVTDLPLQVGMLVDTSASMAEMLPQVQEAALQFFHEALAPMDRAAIVTFSEEPRLAAPFTRDVDRLGAALVGLQAARGTALWDSLVYTLHYFQGTGGRRALLVFSDGADRGSRFTFDQALAYAQHSGVSVYAVSFGGVASSLLETGRRRLANLAEATGGRSFVLGGVGELDATYRAIEEDLRSQYLLVYQSDGEGETFRAVAVEVRRPGVTARTMRGYIP